MQLPKSMIYGLLALCMVNVMACEAVPKTTVPATVAAATTASTTNAPAPKVTPKTNVEKKDEKPVDESKKLEEKVAQLQKELKEASLALAKKAAAKTPTFKSEEEKKKHDEEQKKKLQDAAKESVKILSPAIKDAYKASNGWRGFNSSQFDEDLAKIIVENADVLINTLDADRLDLAREAKKTLQLKREVKAALQEQASKKPTEESKDKKGSTGSNRAMMFFLFAVVLAAIVGMVLLWINREKIF